MPHPYCDFCEQFLFNDLAFVDHINRHHLTCHLCGDYHKNVYYKEYSNLETHFTMTHYICPYEICKAKCYVAFKTEDELRTHLDIEHKMNAGAIKGGKVEANALLGFGQAKEDEDFDDDGDFGGSRGRGGRGRGRGNRGQHGNHVVIKDSEGVDFNYYFSQKYYMSLENRRKKEEQRSSRGGRNERGFRGGRGRGGRGGRGRGGFHDER